MHFSSGASPIEIRTSVTHRTEIYEELVVFHHRKIYGEYLLLSFLIVMGLIFLHKGKIRSVIFDRGEGTLTVKKRYYLNY